MKHLGNSGKNKTWQNSFSMSVGIVSALLMMTIILSGCSQGTTPTPTGPSPTNLVATKSPTTGPSLTKPPTTTPTITKPAVPLTSIRMLDGSHGWALTHHSILLTTDGGLHWKDVSPTNLLGNGYLGGGDFLNISTAWVSLLTPVHQTQILQTSDSGQHWETIPLQSGVPDRPHFINAKDGWIETLGGAATGHVAAYIYQTTDGGQTWEKVATADYTTPIGPGFLPFEGDKTGIAFKDATTGWATGMEGARPDFSWLYITHDGGKTWHHQDLPLLPGISNAIIVTTPPVFFGDTGILPVTVNTLHGDIEVLYVTHDGGNTWKSTTPLNANVYRQDGVYVLDVRHTWVTDGKAFYRTSDGGQHWTGPISSIQQGVSSMSFVSSTTGWAIGNSQTNNEPLLFKTTDGGQTWAKIDYTIGNW